jgi:MYXO-CTERM domain-containing protein
MVLLGGEVWPSAFGMAEAIEARLLVQQSSEAPPPSIIVELGAGVGLCGLVAAAAVRRRPQQHQQQHGPCRVYLTDESPELVAINAGLFRTEWLGSSSSSPSLDVTVEVGGLD